MRAHHAALTCLAVLATQAGADEALDGKALYEARCGGCHALDADRTGPHHAGVFGRKAGSVAGVLVAALLDFALRALLGSVPGLGAHYDVLLCPLVTAWYLLTELGSVVENAGALGAPLPQFLVRAIAVLRADISQHGGGDDDA